jgi:hypothetical protein
VHAQQRAYGYDDYPMAGQGELGRNALTDAAGARAGTNGHDRNSRAGMEVPANEF